MIKLYHAQVYEFGYHRAKLSLLRQGELDDRRNGDRKFAPLADFLESCATGEPVQPDFRSALRTQQVCDAVLASAEAGRWVDIPADGT